jgi:hypothetical protein
MPFVPLLSRVAASVFIVLATPHLFLALLCRCQLAAEDIIPYIGPTNEAKRDLMRRKARLAMRTQYRCDTDPEVKAAVSAFVNLTYPAWFVHSFFAFPETDKMRPCPNLYVPPLPAKTAGAVDPSS